MQSWILLVHFRLTSLDMDKLATLLMQKDCERCVRDGEPCTGRIRRAALMMHADENSCRAGPGGGNVGARPGSGAAARGGGVRAGDIGFFFRGFCGFFRRRWFTAMGPLLRRTQRRRRSARPGVNAAARGGGVRAGDPQPLAALGDALAARADRCAPSGEDPLGFLRAALEQGYRAALRLHARDGDALVGVAEVGKPFSFFFLRVPLCPSVRACWCVRHSMVRLQRLRPLHGGTFRPTHARRQPRAQLVPVWDVHPPVPACVIRVFLNVLPRSFLTLTQ